MAQQFLHGADILPGFQQVRREAMAHDVRRHARRDEPAA